MLIIRRSKLHYRASGIITPIGEKVTNTLKICNIYCFSTVTMVTRTRLIVTLYVQYTACFVTIKIVWDMTPYRFVNRNISEFATSIFGEAFLNYPKSSVTIYQSSTPLCRSPSHIDSRPSTFSSSQRFSFIIWSERYSA